MFVIERFKELTISRICDLLGYRFRVPKEYVNGL